MGYNNDKQRVDKFEPEIKMLLGQHYITTATRHQDCREATDLVLVLPATQVRIGCRVRRFDAWERVAYRTQFTIRSGRPSGQPVEHQKIMDGWGQCLFYGFADQGDRFLHHGTLIDLDVFRDCVKRGVKPRNTPNNHDDSSWFCAYDMRDFPRILVLNSWHWDGDTITYPATANNVIQVAP